jgi:hypothetical protein
MNPSFGGSYKRITGFDYEAFSIVMALFIVVFYCCVACILQNSDHFNGGFDHRFFSMGQHRFNQVGYFKNNNYKLGIPLICSYGGQYYIVERLSRLISSNHIQFLHFFFKFKFHFFPCVNGTYLDRWNSWDSRCLVFDCRHD